MKQGSTILWLTLFILLFFVYLASADCLDRDDGRHEKVTITSSSQGTRIVSSISGGCSIIVKPGSSGAVWVSRTTGTCTSTLTANSGDPISVDSGTHYSAGYEYIPKVDGYSGQLCGILESGSTAIDLCVNCW